MTSGTDDNIGAFICRAHAKLQATQEPAQAGSCLTSGRRLRATVLKDNHHAVLTKRRNGCYLDDELQSMWWAWQARAAPAREGQARLEQRTTARGVAAHQYKAVSLADAQVIALEALASQTTPPAAPSQEPAVCRKGGLTLTQTQHDSPLNSECLLLDTENLSVVR